MDSLLRGWETGLGLDVVIWLQAHTPEPLRVLAIALAILGGFPVYFLLFFALYWSVNKAVARRLLLALLVSGLVIAGLKLALQRPRPFVAYPDLVYASLADTTFGFPSGHVGITLPVLGVLAAAVNRRRAWWLLAVYVALMGWARMVAGVHYPQDVIGGVLIGLIVLLAVLRLPARLTSWDWFGSGTRAIALLLVVAACILFLRQDLFAVVAAGAILGATPGFALERRAISASTAGTFAQRLLRSVVGLTLIALLITLAVFAGLPDWPVLLQVTVYSLIAFFGVAVYPWLALRLGLAQPEQ